MRVENFRKLNLYDRSIDLMISIYRLIDNYQLDPDDKQSKEIFQIAIKVPKILASGIGQINMKTRFKKFNEAKEKVIELRWILDQFGNMDDINKVYLDDIEGNRIQVLKMLNSYFGWLKKQNDDVGENGGTFN